MYDCMYVCVYLFLYICYVCMYVCMYILLYSVIGTVYSGILTLLSNLEYIHFLASSLFQLLGNSFILHLYILFVKCYIFSIICIFLKFFSHIFHDRCVIRCYLKC